MLLLIIVLLCMVLLLIWLLLLLMLLLQTGICLCWPLANLRRRRSSRGTKARRWCNRRPERIRAAPAEGCQK